MPRKTRKANGRKRPKKDGWGRKRDNNATRIFTKSFALCKRFCSVKSGRRRWGRCVRNRQIERRRRAEKSHDRLLVRNGVQIETTLRKISHKRRAACEIQKRSGADPRGAVNKNSHGGRVVAVFESIAYQFIDGNFIKPRKRYAVRYVWYMGIAFPTAQIRLHNSRFS